MAISFAGVDLLLEDPGHELQTWLERNLPLSDMEIFSTPVARTEGRDSDRSQTKAFVGLPTPNYSGYSPPDWRINTLWWPTGAARWAVGLFLANGDQMAQILSALNGAGQGTLVFDEDDEGDNRTIEVTMTMLPPRRLADVTDVDRAEKLWLLPLVDERWWWQFRDVGSLSLDNDSTFNTIVSAISDQIGATIYSTNASSSSTFQPGTSVEAVPYTPHVGEFTRQHENAALILDAVGETTGTRLIADLDGTVRLLSPSSCRKRLRLNQDLVDEGGTGYTIEKGYSVLAGGETYRSIPKTTIPKQIKIVFPKGQGNGPQDDGDVYTLTANASTFISGNDLSTASSTKVLYTTVLADFTGGSGDPDNLAALQSYATALATDYYGWLSDTDYDTSPQTSKPVEPHYDHSFSGIKYWHPTGFDDWIWWHFGYQYKPLPSMEGGDHEGREGDYASYTRVKSQPYNFGSSERLHQLVEQTDRVILLEVTGSSGITDKSSVFATSDSYPCIWDGRELIYTTGTADPCADDPYTDGDNCWLLPINLQWDQVLIKGERYRGTEAGTLTINGDERPLWLIRHAEVIPVVEVTGSSSGTSDGEDISPDDDCIYSGKVIAFDNTQDPCDGPFADRDNCWVLPLNYSNSTMTKGDKFLAKHIGYHTFNNDGRPLYAVRASRSSKPFRLTADYQNSVYFDQADPDLATLKALGEVRGDNNLQVRFYQDDPPITVGGTKTAIGNSSSVEILTPENWDDPTLRFKKAGTWIIETQLNCTVNDFTQDYWYDNLSSGGSATHPPKDGTDGLYETWENRQVYDGTGTPVADRFYTPIFWAGREINIRASVTLQRRATSADAWSFVDTRATLQFSFTPVNSATSGSQLLLRYAGFARVFVEDVVENEELLIEVVGGSDSVLTVADNHWGFYFGSYLHFFFTPPD